MPKELYYLSPVICQHLVMGTPRSTVCNTRNIVFRIQRHSVSMQTATSRYNIAPCTIKFDEEHYTISWDELINEQSRISTFATMAVIVGVDIHITSEHCNREPPFSIITSTWNNAYSSSSPSLLNGNISGLYFQLLLPAIWQHTSTECKWWWFPQHAKYIKWNWGHRHVKAVVIPQLDIHYLGADVVIARHLTFLIMSHSSAATTAKPVLK